MSSITPFSKIGKQRMLETVSNDSKIFDHGNGGGGMDNRLKLLEDTVLKLDVRAKRLESSFARLENSNIEIINALNSFKKWVTAILLTCFALVVGILTLYTGWVLHDSNRNWEQSLKTMDKIHAIELRLVLQL